MFTLHLLLILDENVKVVSVPNDIDAQSLRELAASTFGMKPEAIGVKYYDNDI